MKVMMEKMAQRAVKLALEELTKHNDDARAAAERRIARGEGITWYDMIDVMSRKRQSDLLKEVLRLRRKHVSVAINGNSWGVPRAVLRDYLREVDMPVYFRKRPSPPSMSATIKFRRPVLFRP